MLCLLMNVTFGRKNSELFKKKDVGKDREAKLFSLFSIVTFKNDPCITSQDGLTGTCMSSMECQIAGGINQGNCAAGEHL